MSTEIDPQLPYIQVHRSVAAMAAQVAGRINVTYQHARGGLDVFWESLADRRILGRAIKLPVPMVLLADAECRQRLWLAFGCQVEPEVMQAAGALELQPSGEWRVRGMSRYIDAELARLKKKANHQRATPTPHPADTSRTGVPPGCDPPGTRAQQGSDPTEVRGERREVRDESEEVRLHTSPADEFWGWAQGLREKAGCVREHPPKGRALSGWYSAALMELNGDEQRLREGWLAFGDDPHWQAATPPCPFAAFMHAETGWRRFVPRARKTA